MIKSKIIEELLENSNDSLSLCVAAEESDPEFTLVRELLEQLLDELETLEP